MSSRLIAWIMFLQYLHDQVIVATSQVFSLRPSVRAPFLRRENALLKDCRSWRQLSWLCSSSSWLNMRLWSSSSSLLSYWSLGEPWKQILLKVEILSICFPYNGRRITLWEHFAFNNLWSCKACRVHQGLLDYHDSVLHDKHYHDKHHHEIIIMPVSPILIFFS